MKLNQSLFPLLLPIALLNASAAIGEEEAPKITLSTNCDTFGVEQAPDNKEVQKIFKELCQKTQEALFKSKFDVRLYWLVTERNPTFWRFSWKIEGKHEFSKSFELKITSQFLDEQKFSLETQTLGPHSIEPKKKLEESGYVLVPTERASKVHSIVSKVTIGLGDEEFLLEEKTRRIIP